MTTSYDNVGGKGDRSRIVGFLHLGSGYIGLIGGMSNPMFIDGSYTNGPYWMGAANTHEFLFTFEWPVIIDEITWFQSDAATHGTWQVKGSNNNTNWDDIGATFTLGGSVAQVITTISANTTPYKYYKISGVSGSVYFGSYIQEIEFNLVWSPVPTTSYTFTGGMGDRTSTIVVSTDLSLYNGPVSKLIDGDYTNLSLYFAAQAVSGKYIKFDFGADVLKILTEATWFQYQAGSNGTWKWQGSLNDTNWVDVGGTFVLGGAEKQIQTTMAGNTIGYRYYRLLGVSGDYSSYSYNYEILFQIGEPEAPTSTGRLKILEGGEWRFIASGASGYSGYSGPSNDVVDYLTPQLGGDLDLNNNNIIYSYPPSGDLATNGCIMSVTVDTNAVGIGAPLFMSADGHLDTASASASTIAPCVALTLETGTGTKKVLLKGVIRNDSWDWVTGPGKLCLIYLGVTTGTLTQTQPSGADNIIQVIGFALSADVMYFNPQYYYITHV